MSDHERADIGIWRLADGTPQRYLPALLELESHLEDWIERDPTLIASDMHFVGRQIRLATGFLDILGIDKLGRWAVIELKKANVRRETVGQAIDYGSSLAAMKSPELKALVKQVLEKRGIKLPEFLKQLSLDDDIFEQPEFLIYVVGTSRDINLNRIANDTAFRGNPINVVTFDVYKNKDGEHVLLRQLTEADSTPAPGTSTTPKKAVPNNKSSSPDDRLTRLMKLAKENEVGKEFRKVYDLATGFGLYPKLYKWSIMYAPPQNKNRVLICAWVNRKENLFDVYINTDAFAEFYPISQRKARQIAGDPLRYYLTPEQTEEFISMTQKLFDEIQRNS